MSVDGATRSRSGRRRHSEALRALLEPPPSRIVEQAQRRIRAAVHARRHAMPQSFNHLPAGRGTTPARLRRCPTVPGMDGIHALPVEPVLEQPVRRRRPHLFTSAPLSLAPLLVRDPPVELPHGSRRLLHDHTAREAQQLQSGGLVGRSCVRFCGWVAATTRAPVLCQRTLSVCHRRLIASSSRNHAGGM